MPSLRYLPLIVCLVGLILWCLVDRTKPNEVGREMFKWGLRATLLLKVLG